MSPWRRPVAVSDYGPRSRRVTPSSFLRKTNTHMLNRHDSWDVMPSIDRTLLEQSPKEFVLEKTVAKLSS